MPDNPDLSEVFSNPDLEAAQDEYDAMPEEMKNHLIAAIKHKAGLGLHPGKYSGPPLKKDWCSTVGSCRRAGNQDLIDEQTT